MPFDLFLAAGSDGATPTYVWETLMNAHDETRPSTASFQLPRSVSAFHR